MDMSATSERVSIGRLILWPSIITLAITVLRLVGELQHWSPRFFNPEPGGGGAIVGISWLPLIFGVYFALKLVGAGEAPESASKAIFVPVLGIVLIVAGAVASTLASKTPTPGTIVIINIAALIALVVQRYSWHALFRTLLAYAFAARIPVALIMLIAIYRNWGTHYDVAPPDFPAMHWFLKWLLIGALPQFLIWIAFTVIVGGLVGGITGAIARRRTSTQQPATA
jgi:hypothetical protein